MCLMVCDLLLLREHTERLDTFRLHCTELQTFLGDNYILTVLMSHYDVSDTSIDSFN